MSVLGSLKVKHFRLSRWRYFRLARKDGRLMGGVYIPTIPTSAKVKERGRMKREVELSWRGVLRDWQVG